MENGCLMTRTQIAEKLNISRSTLYSKWLIEIISNVI